MTGTQTMILILVGIVVTGLTVTSVVGDWKKVQLAKHGLREGRDGNVQKL